eukprot:s2634_g1.t1
MFDHHKVKTNQIPIRGSSRDAAGHGVWLRLSILREVAGAAPGCYRVHSATFASHARGCSRRPFGPAGPGRGHALAARPFSCTTETTGGVPAQILMSRNSGTLQMDVTPKPIFAISDGPGVVAELVAKMGFRQFGDISKSMVEVLAEVETKEDVKAAIDKAATLAPEESLAIEQAGAMVIFSMSDKNLAEFLVTECGQQGVPCINFMESVVLALERRLQVPRGSEAAPPSGPLGIFAVSDSSAEASYRIGCKALKQFPKAKVQQITCCPGVQSLQEIDHIVQEALHQNSVIIYTLASPGMSRFLRQQCERAKVPYADVFQPVVIALERYLDYPPVGATLAALAPDEFEGKTAKAVKQALAVQIGVTRFRQRLFSECGSEIPDDEVFTPAPVKLQMVVLGFHPANAERNKQVISASVGKDLIALEKFLNSPSNPNVRDEHGNTPLHLAAREGHVESMLLLLEAGAEKDLPNEAIGGKTPLFIAAENGHLDVVRHLVEVGADTDKTMADGATPLLIAAHNSHLEVVRHLVEVGADKDKTMADGATPLLTAAHNGHLEVVRHLVEVGADKDKATADGATPLFIAAQNGHLDVVCHLVEVGADTDKAMADGATPLFIAAQNGRLDVVCHLVEVGADTDKAMADGATPLLIAAQNGHLEVVRHLVEVGADKDKAMAGDATPLFIAAQNGQCDVVRYLVEVGADKDKAMADDATPLFIAAQNGHLDVVRHLVEVATPLFIAAQNGHLDVVRHLVEVGADKDQPTCSRPTPLFIAAQNGHLDVVRHLVEVGDDKDQANKHDGAIPLLIAAHNGHLDVVRYLVKVGADTDKAMADGATPLFIAAQNGHVDVVRHLVEVGADKDQANKRDGETPLLIAAENGHVDVVRNLVEVGAVTDKATADGATPLFIAAQNGHLDVVRHLVEVRADTDKGMADGATPLFIAAQNGHVDVVRHLVEVGADKDQANKRDGETPLLIAAENSHVDVVGHLVKVGSHKDQANKYQGASAMQIAAHNGNRDVVRDLADASQNCLRGILRQLGKVGAHKFWGNSVACCSRRRRS